MSELLTGDASRALALALVHFVWQGAAIALAVAALFALLRRASPNLRYLAGCLGLAAMVAAPVITFTLSLPSRPAPVLSSAPEQVALALTSLPASQALERSAQPTRAAFAAATWLPAVTTIWIVGVLVLTIRLMGGWVAVRRVRRRATTMVPEPLRRRGLSVAIALGITRQVLLRTSSAVDVPTVVGWWRPVILLPVGALSGLSPFQVEAILAHELAHIRRHDYLVNLLQTVVETLLFYHPAVWWLSNRVRAEREHCCDDAAVTYCGDRVAYAGALASLEQLRLRAPVLLVAANGSDLLARIRRVLGVPSQSHPTASPVWILAAVLAMVPVAAQLVGAQPRPTALPTTEDVTAPPALPNPGAAAARLSAVTGQEPTATPVAAPPEPSGPGAYLRAKIEQYRQSVPSPRTPSSAAVPEAPAPQRSGPGSDLRTKIDQYQQREPQQATDDRMLRVIQATLAKPLGTYFDRQEAPTFFALEEKLRQARLSTDRAALSALLDPDFSGTDPTGATRTRDQLLQALIASPITSLSYESVTGTIADDGATVFTSGVQVRVINRVQERVQFTHVWRGVTIAGGGLLVRSVEFKIASALATVAAPASTAVAPVGNPYRVGRDVQEPRLLTPNIKPVYPQAAKDAGIQGLVIIEAVIDEQGSVSSAKVIKPVHPLLDQAAIDAVRQWKYTPTLLAGKPVSVLLNVTVNFALQ